MLTFGSLFAGIGGFDLGFERAGMRCEWQVELDEFCRRVLAKHWPDVRRHDDIRTFPGDVQDEWRVDVICGGFPCKQTSTGSAIHGRRNGLSGADSGLWWQMHRVINSLSPRIVVIENPPGALTWSKTIEGSLADSFYRVQRLEVAAAHVGAPHLRRRVFWIANLNGTRLEITGPAGSPAAESLPWRTADRNTWLSSLAELSRVDDGIPGELDRAARIEACGNSVVPQVAEWLGRQIVESMKA